MPTLRQGRAHDALERGRPSPSWLHRLRAGSILREFMRPRSGVHHRAGYSGDVVVGADHRGGGVTSASDEPTAQAQAIMERVLRLVTECYAPLNAQVKLASHRALRRSEFSTSR